MIGENGIKLSGGQRQRLAIARSIIKRPAILILDEATSSIDVRGERIVQEALDRVSKNRTTITIAHRLSTIKKANNIIVFKNGTAVEQGTHESLLSNEKGVYYDLVHAQQLIMADSEDALLTDDVDGLHRTVTGKSQDGVAVPVAEDKVQGAAPEYKSRGVVNRVGLFLYEQRAQYLYYSLILVAAMGAGGESFRFSLHPFSPSLEAIYGSLSCSETDYFSAGFAIQSFIFAKIMTVFQYMGQKLISGGNFWGLMYFVEAIAVSLCYFTLGWVANSVAVVSPKFHYFPAYLHLHLESRNNIPTTVLRMHSSRTNIILRRRRPLSRDTDVPTLN
jgi:ATP-binding cassette, subfamily B (MDR/TAP), member 1